MIYFAIFAYMSNSSLYNQSQGHGFFWEAEVVQKVFNLPPKDNDTSKYDISSENNRFGDGHVSIKTTGSSSVGLGDIIRFYTGDFDSGYSIIIIRYSQKGEKKAIKETIEIAYTKELRDYLFGTAGIDVLQEYVSFVKSIPAGPVPKPLKDSYKAKKKAIQKGHGMAIGINPKVDSKSQRRVQCSFNIEKIIAAFPGCLKYKSLDGEVRGARLTESIDSPRRKRSK